MVKLRCPNLHSFGHGPAPAAGTICPARPVWYRVQTGAASGRVPVFRALHGLRLHLARPALLPVMCSRSGCAGAGVSTGGVYSRHPAPPGQSFNHRKNKKGLKNTPPPIINSKNFPQKQKDPYKGSEFCAILALQALKGRNLQWLKVK